MIAGFLPFILNKLFYFLCSHRLKAIMVNHHMDTDHLLQTKDMDTLQALDILLLLMVSLPHQVIIPLHLKDILLLLDLEELLLKDTHKDNMVHLEEIIHLHHPSIIRDMVHLLVVMASIDRLAQVIRYLLILDLVLLLVLPQDLVNIQVMTKVEDIHRIHKEGRRPLAQGLQDHLLRNDRT